MRRGSSTIVIAVVTAALALVVLIWSAGQGEPLVSAPEGSWGPPRATEGWLPTMPDLTLAPEPQASGERDPVEPDRWWVWLVTALFLMAVLTTVLLVVRWLAKQRYEEKERRAAAEEDELVALLEATSDDVRYRALSEGDPRNGVVACWVALEDAVQRSGLERDRSETAAELTTRVLSRWEVDPAAITDLSEAYREARFSRHPVTEDQRTAAVEALERIHADLRRRVAAEEQARQATEQQAAEQQTAAQRAAEQGARKEQRR